jgi:hypothetical protein
VRFCACVREISKQSQVSPKARHTRRLLLLKKSCREELLRFYARRNPRHCSRACAATTSRPETSALQPPLCRCVSSLDAWQNLALQPCVHRRHVTPGVISAAAAAAPLHLDAWQNAWCCSHVCAAAMSRLGTLALQPLLRRCVSTPGETPMLQPCVHCPHVTPGVIRLLHLDAPAAMHALPPRHAWGHWRCSSCCAAAS